MEVRVRLTKEELERIVDALRELDEEYWIDAGYTQDRCPGLYTKLQKALQFFERFEDY